VNLLAVLKKQIVSDRVEIGPPYVTRYEYATLVAVLAVQIAYGAPILLSQEELKEIEATNPIEIAKLEIKKKRVPLTILRYLPTGEYQLVPLTWLEIYEE